MKPSKNHVYRHLNYLQVLQRLKHQGICTVSSYNLAGLCNVSASLLRKDFMALPFQGKQKVGYDVAELVDGINKVIHRESVEPIIVVGVGSFGSALMKYNNFEFYNLKIIAGFDINTTPRDGISKPIYPLSKVKEVIDDHQVKLAILTVPEMSAQVVARNLADLGISKILNFTPAVLNLPSQVNVNNVNLAFELEYLLFDTSNN